MQENNHLYPPRTGNCLMDTTLMYAGTNGPKGNQTIYLIVSLYEAGAVLVGLSKPHNSETALCTCVCIHTYVLAAIYCKF